MDHQHRAGSAPRSHSQRRRSTKQKVHRSHTPRPFLLKCKLAWRRYSVRAARITKILCREIAPSSSTVSKRFLYTRTEKHGTDVMTLGRDRPCLRMKRNEEELMEDDVQGAIDSSTNTTVLTAEIIESFPMATLLSARHRLFGGFWQAEFVLKGMAATRTGFKPNPSADILLLATLPKSGTTWLKALAFATLNRAAHSPSNSHHPLRHQNPHDCVNWLEHLIMQDRIDDTTVASCPRLLHTHMPYSQLHPHGITAERCRIVYVCHDPKDVLVSAWYFHNSIRRNGGSGEEWAAVASAGLKATTPSFEEAFELFCQGRFPGGPHWLHALEYWQESKRRPEEVLFLRYEDIARDPVAMVRKLATFMGCKFEEKEEAAGVPDQIVELCSLGSLKGMDVNRNGRTLMGFKNEAFFRKGQVGDWKNYLTLDMAARLDKIVEEATRGSGLTFGDSSSGSV